MINGHASSTNDLLFCLSLLANLAKRHPRTYRLLTRNENSLSLGITMTQDPFKCLEADPLQTRALRSSLWEVQIIMKQHQDTRVRDYCKIFKTDLMAKTNYQKVDQFVGDSL